MSSANLIQLINSATERLKKIDIDVPRLNVERMLCSLLVCKRAELYLDRERSVSADVVGRLEELLERRLAREPLQYILGETEFYGIALKCDRRALIPRPETEFVVTKTVELLQDADKLYIADIGCGSGCIGIAIALNLPQASITATDMSEDALSLAKENVLTLGLLQRFRFFTGSIYDPLGAEKTIFDAIVSNPPYIREGEWQILHEQVREFEPRRALLAGADGLDFIRQLVSGAAEFLVPNGYLMFEMGAGQADAVRELVQESHDLGFVDTVRDYAGIERVAVARKRPPS